MQLLPEKYASEISGTLSCYDRLLFRGTLPGLCYAEGMSRHLSYEGIRIFDYTQEFCEPLRQAIRTNAEGIAAENNISIEFVSKSYIRKESIVKKVIATRGDSPGLVHILSAMETCSTFKPHYDKATGKSSLRYSKGKCLHYYFYFIDKELGLCYIRVPTWAPFEVQVYCNGHFILAQSLKQEEIDYELLENAFLSISDIDRAQVLSDEISPKQLHSRLDKLVEIGCPVAKQLEINYHWSIAQGEYATDIIFSDNQTLAPLYEHIVRSCVVAVKADQVSAFLGRKLNGNYAQEVTSRLSTRIEGRCIKHTMGKVSVKMYDKFSRVLRIETTTNDVTFFKHYRSVECRNGEKIKKQATMKKSLYSLGALREALLACNKRYLEFISSVDDPRPGEKALNHVTESVKENKRSYRGFNFFEKKDQQVLEQLSRGEYITYGFQNKDLRQRMNKQSSRQISHTLKRLRTHGIVKKAARSRRYYLTSMGKKLVNAVLQIKAFIAVPELAQTAA